MVYVKGFKNFIIAILKSLAKIKPLRPKMEELIEKVPIFVNDFQKAVKDFIFQEHFKYLGIKLIKVIALVSCSFVPFFVANAIGLNVPWEHFGLFFVASYITNNFLGWFPTPGASGANEIYFIKIVSFLGFSISQNHALTVVFISRLLNYYLWMLFGFVFYIVLIVREKKMQTLQVKRTNQIINKQYEKKPIDLLYLTADFNYLDISKYESFYQKLNINILVLAKNINNETSYKNNQVTVIKRTKHNFKKELKKIMVNPPEVMLTNTGGAFGFNARKYSHNIKAPLIFLKDKPLDKETNLLYQEADLILNNEDLELDNVININDIASLNNQELRKLFISKLNLYNINKIEKLEHAKVLILGGDTFLGREIALSLLDKTLSVTCLQNEKVFIHKKVKTQVISLDEKNLKKVFRANHYDIIIDCLNEENIPKDFYSYFFKQIIDFNTNYYFFSK